MLKYLMALNVKKLMALDHPEVTYPPPPLLASKGHEELSLENHTGEEQVLLEIKKRESLERHKEPLKLLDIIS